MKNPLLLSLFGLSMGFVGWLAGRYSPTGDVPKDVPAAKPPVAVAVAAPTPSLTTKSPPSSPKVSTKQDALQILRKAVYLKDPVERTKQYLIALDSITPQNWELFREAHIALLTEGYEDDNLASLSAEKFAEVSGASILKSRTGTPSDFKANRTLAGEIAGAFKSDADGVRAWFDGLTNEKWREAVLPHYLKAMAAKTPDAMLELMTKLPPEFHDDCLSAMVKGVKQGADNATLSDWLEQKIATHPQATWLPEVFTKTMENFQKHRYASPQVAAFLEEHAGKPYASYEEVETVAKGLVNQRGPEAFDWVSRMEKSAPDDIETSQLYQTMVSSAIDTDLPKIVNWVSEHLTGEQKQVVLANLAPRVDTLPESVRAELQTILEQKP